jgi:GLPGLI family protein
MTGETKAILNHNCMKATATQTSSSTRMTMDNGKMERKVVEDTSLVVAWFASDIPVSAGPAEYQGQLPGLILEMDVASGRQTFRATEISAKADLASIKAPTGKKHYTREEFRKEVDKMMDEMQRNNGGPGRTIRISN